MSQFKRFNTSDNNNWDTSSVYPAGTLTWDQDNGLRLHDGYTNGGNTIGGSSSVSWGDIENKPYGTTAVHDLIGGSSSADDGKFLKQNSIGNSTWAYPNVLQYDSYQLTMLSDGTISLPNGSIIDNQKAVDHIVGGADIQISDLAYATEGNPTGAVIDSDSYTNSGWQYIMFDNADVYNTVTGMTGTSTGYWPVTWAEGSTQRTGYVVIQFLGGNQFQICPVLNDTDGNNTPVSGTWKFPLNLRGSVVYNGNVTLTVGSDLGNKTYTFGDTGYITLPAGGLLSDTKEDEQDPSTFGVSLTGVGYSQLYWDGAPGTGNPFNGSDLFSWMYADGFGITLGYRNAEESVEYEWNFDTNGNLQLPEGGTILNSNGDSVIPNQFLNTTNNVEFASLYISGSSANEGGEMRLALAPNTTLTGTGVTIDVYTNKLRIFEQGGNARGVYIDLTQAADSVGTNLLAPVINANNLTGITLNSGVVNSSLTSVGTLGSLTVTGTTTINGTDSNVVRRAVGLVAADTYVTLDDLKARVTSSTSQLSLTLTTGSWQATGWTETFQGGGTPSVSNWINLPLSSGFDSASGAMPNQGNGCRCVISDQSPSAKMYQITAMRAGTSGAMWNICIERLV